MPVWSVLLHIGAIASIYFLVTMLSALVHGDPEARARLQAAGLAASLILMMAGALIRPFPTGAEPAEPRRCVTHHACPAPPSGRQWGKSPPGMAQFGSRTSRRGSGDGWRSNTRRSDTGSGPICGEGDSAVSEAAAQVGGGAPGQDPSSGKDLGDWGAWQNGGTLTTGWYELSFGDAGGGKVPRRRPREHRLVHGDERHDGLGHALGPDGHSGPHPWLLRALSWDVGAAWSWGEGADKVTFAITGKRAFAGITGAWGEWKDADGGGSEYCVNPNVPLALYLKLITDDKNYMEYVLTECGGF